MKQGLVKKFLDLKNRAEARGRRKDEYRYDSLRTEVS